MSSSGSSEVIEHFWQKFLEHKDILATPDDEKDDQMMAVLDCLKKVDPRLYYDVGYRDAGPDLLLSAEGDVGLAPLVAECIAKAPSCAGWRFRAILDSESLSGERNYSLYPDDENGDILFGIAARAGDLVTSREVDFCHVFPSEFAARSFASGLLESDEIVIEPYDRAEGHTWQVRVTRKMRPAHDNITAHETNLAALANLQRGRPDGWGFWST